MAAKQSLLFEVRHTAISCVHPNTLWLNNGTEWRRWMMLWYWLVFVSKSVGFKFRKARAESACALDQQATPPKALANARGGPP